MLTEASTAAAAVREATTIKWDAPYRLLASTVGMLYVFSGYQRPLVPAQQAAEWLGSDTARSALGTADTWLFERLSVLGASGYLWLAVVVAAIVAAQGMTIPTRAAGTFWILAALATYTGLGIEQLIAAVVVAEVIRVIRSRIMEKPWDEDAVLVSLNVLAALFFAPFIIAAWPGQERLTQTTTRCERPVTWHPRDRSALTA